jgi:hypothetical protein
LAENNLRKESLLEIQIKVLTFTPGFELIRDISVFFSATQGRNILERFLI